MKKRLFCMVCALLLLLGNAQAVSLSELLNDKGAAALDVDSLMGRKPDRTREEDVALSGGTVHCIVDTYTFASEEAMMSAADAFNEAFQQAGYEASNVSGDGTTALLYALGDDFRLLLLDSANACCVVAKPSEGGSNPQSGQSADKTFKLTVNGEEKEYRVTNLYTVDVGPSICLELSATNPRGERESSMSLLIPADIGPDTPLDSATLRSTKAWREARISYFQGSAVNMWTAMCSSVYGFADNASSFRMTVTSRSDDWRHYEGTLEAVLPPAKTANGSAFNVEITNGTYSFTMP